MSNSYTNAANSPRTCRLIMGLWAVLAMPLLADRSAMADKANTVRVLGASGQRLDSASIQRLPAVDSMNEASASVSMPGLPGPPAIVASYEGATFDDSEPVSSSEDSSAEPKLQPLPAWLESVSVGYDRGFVIASEKTQDLKASDLPFSLRINGWGQLRHVVLDSQGPTPDLNQFELTRGRMVFQGSAFTPDFGYYVQLDGRSSGGDNVRLLDYLLTFDIGRNLWGFDEGTLQFKTGQYKMPFTMARWLSGREFEFSDRSMASMYFDVNRSLAWGLAGRTTWRGAPGTGKLRSSTGS